MAEYRKGTVAWVQHSSESAHESLARGLRESQERERVRKEKASKKQSEFYGRLREISTETDEKIKSDSEMFRAKREAKQLAKIEADRRHAEYVAGPEGQRAARAAQLRIEFPGWSEEAIQSQLRKEFGPEPIVKLGKNRGLLGLGVLPI